jgi:cytochrome c biogenesis protein CcdA
MDGVPIGLGLAAGTVAVVNPCGFALLPAYASLLMLGAERPRRAVALGRALAFAAAMTAGFMLVFGTVGLALASVAAPIQQRLPWFTIVLGLVVVVAGGWLIAGRSLPGPTITTRRGPALTRSLASMTFFGVAYALASLGCTIGPFLVTVVATFRTGSVVQGAVVFAAYATGMGIVVAAVSVAVALARTSLIGTLRRAGRLASRLGGLLLAIAGGYVAYYGWYEIRLQHGQDTRDPIVQAASSIQRALANAVDQVGAIGAVLAVAALVAIATVLKHRRNTARSHDHPDTRPATRPDP